MAAEVGYSCKETNRLYLGENIEDFETFEQKSSNGMFYEEISRLWVWSLVYGFNKVMIISESPITHHCQIT